LKLERLDLIYFDIKVEGDVEFSMTNMIPFMGLVDPMDQNILHLQQ